MSAKLFRAFSFLLLTVILLIPAGSAQAEFIPNNAHAAMMVLGQPDFTSSAAGATSTTMSAPNGVAVDPTTGKIFVADSTNNRVLRFASITALSNGAAAEAVLGQPDFISFAHATTQTGMYGPDHISINANGVLWVADYTNNRVLGFNNASTISNGAPADKVLGQPDFISNAAGTDQDSLNQAEGILADGNSLWVADSGNNRVLLFNQVTVKPNGANASLVLGQANFTSGTAANPPSASTMNWPLGLALDSGGRLWVTDLNNRILRFDNAASKINGAPANGVLGQPDFVSSNSATAQNRSYYPVGVTVDNATGSLYVSENASRILVFENAAALPNGANASYVLGQTDFITNSANTGGISASTLNSPFQIFFDPDKRVLWATDMSNNRVLMYNTTTIVDTTDDLINTNGDCSLREAINAVQTHASVDTCIPGNAIVFDAALNTFPITLGSQLPTITATVSIKGNGAAKTIIQANANVDTAAYRVFSIGITTGNLTLDNLTVRNGKCAGACAVSVSSGGNIINRGVLNVTNSTISGGRASTTGGGIRNTSTGTLTITDSLIDANLATTQGGAVYNEGAFTNITGSTFSNNSATTLAGAIYNVGTTSLTIADSEFSDNTAGGNAGAIYGGNTGGMNIANSSFINNDATAGHGGAIYSQTANTITITNSVFSTNSSSGNGGGIYKSAGLLTVTSSTFSDNSATFIGGGIDADAGSSLTVTNSNFQSNSAGTEGGGINNVSGTLSITNSLFDNNSATYGGGLENGGLATVMLNNTFSNNTAVLYGGGIYNVGNTMNIEDNTFSNNSVSGSSARGGGIYNTTSATLNVTGSTFSGNSALVLTLNGSGGGIYNFNSQTTVKNSVLSGNSAGSGGGIYSNTAGTFTLINVTVSGNSAVGGGGIYNQTGTLTLNNSIVANSATGGDCYNTGTLTANIYNLDSDGTCDSAAQKSPTQIGLLPLADNGGSTQTMALGPYSAAIGAGDNSTCESTDQRGVTRPQGDTCDVGSFERETLVKTSDAANDGWTLESKEFSNVASTLNNSGKLRAGDDAFNRQYRSLLFFDTASIPDNATITKVMVKIYKSGAIGTDPFTTHGDLVADIKKGFFGLAPLQLTDFNAIAEPINTAGRFRDIGSNWHQLTLSSLNYKTINVFGATQFRIRFVLDDNNNKTANIALFDSGGDANPPQLIIEYTVP